MDDSSQPIISTRDVVRVFGSGESAVTAVDKVSIDIMPGEFVSVVGRSGSGKTTLLNIMAGLDSPSSGTILFEGQDLSTIGESGHIELRRHKVSFIFQSFALLPLLSAYENVELPLRINGSPRGIRRSKTEEALEMLGLTPRARHRPYELSGGEQQRVGIARALVTSPRLIIADEPTGELDGTTALSIAAILRDIVEKQGVTLVVATHDLALAEAGDRIIEMADGAIVTSATGVPTYVEDASPA